MADARSRLKLAKLAARGTPTAAFPACSDTAPFDNGSAPACADITATTILAEGISSPATATDAEILNAPASDPGEDFSAPPPPATKPPRRAALREMLADFSNTPGGCDQAYALPPAIAAAWRAPVVTAHAIVSLLPDIARANPMVGCGRPKNVSVMRVPGAGREQR